jgi:hypothetical protein
MGGIKGEIEEQTVTGTGNYLRDIISYQHMESGSNPHPPRHTFPDVANTIKTSPKLSILYGKSSH